MMASAVIKSKQRSLPAAYNGPEQAEYITRVSVIYVLTLYLHGEVSWCRVSRFIEFR